MSTPSRIGRYAVQRRIGSGSFATVWLAYDEQLDAPVAVKVLADNWSEQYDIRTRFVEEGRFLRRVDSPHVVPVYDAGETDDGRPFLVMAYADQGSLAERLEEGTLPVAQSLEVVRQVGAGLQALHDRGVLHRDLKPANVLFRTDDADSRGEAGMRAMVGDLGLGKALDTSSRLTMIGGTPTFVAPEQARGEAPDARADQYSLGVLTFVLLTGSLPWAPASLAAAGSLDPGPPIELSSFGYSADTEAVVLRALSREREQRYPRVADFCAALAASLQDAPRDFTPSGALPLDPQRTQPGIRPSQRTRPAPPGQDDVARRRLPAPLAALLTVLVLALATGVGVAAGWFGVGATQDTRTVHDGRGILTVTVPHEWSVVGREAWTPPGASDPSPALAAGNRADWQNAPSGEGVFLGLLTMRVLPNTLPRHVVCTGTPDVVRGTRQGYPTRLAYTDGCPGGGLMLEGVLKVANNRVLWVQVRAPDRGAATRILDSVTVDGV